MNLPAIREPSRGRWPSTCPVSSNPLTRISKRSGDSICPGKETWATGNRETAFSLCTLLPFFLCVYVFTSQKQQVDFHFNESHGLFFN